MGLLDELKDAMDRLEIRGSQHVDSLINAIEDDEFGDEDENEDEEDEE